MNQLLNASYNGIPGVTFLSSTTTGPSVCISACTHGGETAGLDVIDFLINEFHIQQKLQMGSIYFMLSNRAAYEKYVSTGGFAVARFVDENMNRCCGEENIRNGKTSEAERLREIEPILAGVNYHIDIHSTTESPPTMGIYTEKSKPLFADSINVDEQYSDLTKLQIGKPLIDICERHGGIGIGLEVGIQKDTTAYNNGVDNVLRILAKLGLLNHADVLSYLLPAKANRKIRVVATIMIANKDTFVLTKPLKHGELVQQGTIVASQDGAPIIAQQDYIVILPSPPEKLYSGEEYCFLGVPG